MVKKERLVSDLVETIRVRTLSIMQEQLLTSADVAARTEYAPSSVCNFLSGDRARPHVALSIAKGWPQVADGFGEQDWRALSSTGRRTGEFWREVARRRSGRIRRGRA